MRFSIVLAQLLFALLLGYDALTARRLQYLYIYLLVFGVGSGSALIPFLLSLVKPSSSSYRRLGYFAVIANGVALVATQIISQVRGVPWPYEILLVHLLYVFFFSGLVFRSAAPLAAATWFAYGAASWATGFDGARLSEHLFFMGTVIVLSSVVSFLGERIERIAWLRGRKLDALANRDSLTGLANRRHLLERTRALLRRAAHEGEWVGLLILDIDHFKRINDELGHAVGDVCLRQVAQAIGRSARRSSDLAGRLGGEEFLMVFYGCNADGLARAAEQVRQAVLALALRHPDAPCGRLTISGGGVSRRPQSPTELSALMQIADTALYKAKRLGRNRMCVESAPALPLQLAV